MKKNSWIIFGGICMFASDLEKWLHLTLTCAFLVKYLGKALVKFNDCVTTLICTTLVIAEIILILKCGCIGSGLVCYGVKETFKISYRLASLSPSLTLPSEVCRLQGSGSRKTESCRRFLTTPAKKWHNNSAHSSLARRNNMAPI